MNDFTTFTIVFSPLGNVVKTVEGQNIKLYQGQPAIPGVPFGLFHGHITRRLWNPTGADNQQGVAGITVFDLSKLAVMSSSERISYLNINGQLLAMNMHTGQLFMPR